MRLRKYSLRNAKQTAKGENPLTTFQKNNSTLSVTCKYDLLNMHQFIYNGLLSYLIYFYFLVSLKSEGVEWEEAGIVHNGHL